MEPKVRNICRAPLKKTTCRRHLVGKGEMPKETGLWWLCAKESGNLVVRGGGGTDT